LRSAAKVARGAAHRPSLGALGPAGRGSGAVAPVRLALWLTVAALALEVGYVAVASPRFAVREVEVRADPGVAQQAAARLRPPGPMNFFRAPTRLLTEQVEEAPAVKQARVRRGWPNRLVLVLERREALAVIRRAEQAMLVDPEGVVFALRDEWGWGLPEVVGPHLTPAGMGSAAAKRELDDLLKVLRAMGPEPRLRVARLETSEEGDIAATLATGATVRLGACNELGVKVRLLRAMLDEIGAEEIEHADLSDPAAAYWRPRGRQVSSLVK
jgi:cell division septal protein FtsQ